MPQGQGRRSVVRVGDMNCDSQIDALDTEAFVTAVLDSDGLDHSLCNITNADVNNVGKVDALDTEPFVDLLFPWRGCCDGEVELAAGFGPNRKQTEGSTEKSPGAARRSTRISAIIPARKFVKNFT